MWKVRSAEYSNKHKRQAACEQLVELCKTVNENPNIEFVKAKICTFGNSFRKELKKSPGIRKIRLFITGEARVNVPYTQTIGVNEANPFPALRGFITRRNSMTLNNSI